MKHYLATTGRKFVLPVLLVMVVLASSSATTVAQTRPAGGIERVSPSYATQGDSGVVVTIALAEAVAPPAQVRPLGAKIGTLQGRAVTRSGLQVTATFDIPTDEPLGAREVSVQFPARRHSVVFTLANGFEIRAATVPDDPDVPSGSTSYTIVDTSQDACYDNSSHIACPQASQAFTGQDAQYDGVQPGYVDNGDGTVTDLNTGLMWQKTPGDKVTWAEAVAGAEAFSLAGYDDWRLPTIKELYSLIDFSGVDPSGWSGSDTSGLVPFIDTDTFDFEYGDTSAGERIIDAQYWSSTEYVGTTMNGSTTTFGVNFADGRIKGYGRTDPRGGEMRQFVRYVRGNTDYGVNNFVDNGDGTITDLATGLMWMQADSGEAMNWQEALAYAENLELAGYDDWRLPNAKELQSIVDYTRSPGTTHSAAIAPLFSSTPITDEAGDTNYAFYWSSTTHANQRDGSYAAYVAFGEALGYMHNAWIDVHGAGAQRSDPKSGDPSDWPTGHGPQGDAIRIYNTVRAVRDVE